MEEQDQGRRQSILRSRDRGNELPQGDLRESYILEDNEEGNLCLYRRFKLHYWI